MRIERIILIFGKTGTGKSTKAKELIANEKRVIVIDPRFEYEDNFVIVYNFRDAYNYLINKKEFHLACRFSDDLDFDSLFELIFVLKNICLVVEEAEIYISPYEKRNEFLKLVRYGRHSNIKIIGIARRTSELSLDFRSQVDRIISFQQTDFNDLQTMKKIGFEDLEKLEGHEYKEILL